MVTVFVVSTGFWVASGMVATGGLDSSFFPSDFAGVDGAFVRDPAASRLGASPASRHVAEAINISHVFFIVWFCRSRPPHAWTRSPGRNSAEHQAQKTRHHIPGKSRQVRR